MKIAFHVDLDMDQAEAPDIFDLSVWTDDVRDELTYLHVTMTATPYVNNETPSATVTLEGDPRDVAEALIRIDEYADSITDVID